MIINTILHDSPKISLHYVPQEHSKLGRKKKGKKHTRGLQFMWSIYVRGSVTAV